MHEVSQMRGSRFVAASAYVAFGFRQRIEKPKEMLHARDLECIVYPIADADEGETASVFLVSHVGTHQARQCRQNPRRARWVKSMMRAREVSVRTLF